MRAFVSNEQQLFFAKNGYVGFEELLSSQESHQLLKAILETKKHAPRYPEKNLAKSVPFLLPLIKKKQLGEIAYRLFGRKPLKLEYDEFFQIKPVIEPLDHQSVGLLLFLEDGSGLFFKENLPESSLYTEKQPCYLLLVFTTKTVPHEHNLIVYA